MEKNKLVYLTGLNGIRAIAACAVLLNHINIGLINFNVPGVSLFGFNKGKQSGWNLGEHGVTMFFVLSGFLITFLLLKEREKLGAISIRKFYLRRVLRIWPLYFFFLFISVLAVALINHTLPTGSQLFFYIALMANIPFIFKFVLPVTAHLWSIAVEEQFYLFWPHLFKLKNIKKIIIWSIILLAVIRLGVWTAYPHTKLSSFVTVNRFDCMLFGALLAFLLNERSDIINRLNSKFFQIASWAIFLILFINISVVNAIITMFTVTAATGAIIINQIGNKPKLINLENPVCNFLGKYSYGIYVYHPLLIFLAYKSQLFEHISNPYLKVAVIYIVIIVLTISIAYLSYQLLEKKFLNFKGRYSVVHSTNTNVKSFNSGIEKVL